MSSFLVAKFVATLALLQNENINTPLIFDSSLQPNVFLNIRIQDVSEVSILTLFS
jgi:hypothetical protein